MLLTGTQSNGVLLTTKPTLRVSDVMLLLSQSNSPDKPMKVGSDFEKRGGFEFGASLQVGVPSAPL